MDAYDSSTGDQDIRGLLSYVDRWLADYSGPPELMMGLERGSERSECAVVWLTAEGPAAFGHLTLWESGDIALEIYDADTAECLLLSRGRVTAIAGLAAHLGELVAGCANPTGARSVSGVRDKIGSAAIGAAPSIQRRLHL